MRAIFIMAMIVRYLKIWHTILLGEMMALILDWKLGTAYSRTMPALRLFQITLLLVITQSITARRASIQVARASVMAVCPQYHTFQ